MKDRECDILVVGGGIAGVAIAERLAREASRQGKEVDIVLIERDPQLAMRASSGLEGWFHTGSLYTKINDGQSFTTCLKSLEDMTNWYALDNMFFHRNACAIEYNTGSGIRILPCLELESSKVESYIETSKSWFELPINFVVQSANDSREWARTTRMIQERMKRVYNQQSWVSENSMACQMPTVDVSVPSLDECMNQESRLHMRSADVTMNTGLILRHLADSAARFGVEFLVNHTAILAPHSKDTENHLVAYNSVAKEHVAIRANQIIYALGDQSFSVLDEDLQVNRIQSVMITRQPAIRTENTVVLSEDRADDINHVCHPSSTGGYSILADSNSIKLGIGETESSAETQSEATRAIFDKAKEQFGDVVGDYSSWSMISCVKTEVQPDSNSSRVYSYWWGPEYASWSQPQWADRREENQLETQELIWRAVSQKSDQILESITYDSWALKKAIHYAALNVRVRNSNASDKRFNAIQLIAHETAQAHANSSHMPPIHVIPGKFSLFPSVAHNIYLESEMRGIFLNLKTGQADARALPADIIADSHAIRVLQYDGSV